MQSSEPKERTAEQKAKWAAYIRSYRKRKKLEAGHIVAIEASNGASAPDIGETIGGESKNAD